MKRMAIYTILSGVLLLALTPASVQAQYKIQTVAGSGLGDGALAANAELEGPVGVTTDPAGNIYIADASGYRVRKIDPAGIITTIGGNGVYGYTGDGGPATAASIGGIYGLALDKTGNLFVVDQSFSCVRKISTSGIITTVAGNGTASYTGDGGPATAATLNNPIDAVVDTNGNLYITDWMNNVVRKVNTAGIISTAVGNGSIGTSGNGGPATASQLGAPFRITKDNKGNLYIAEVQEQFVCKVDAGGIITIVGGTGAYGTGIDGDGGPATAATMTSPCGIAVDTSGHLYFSDINNYRVRMIDLNTGIISMYAANGVTGFGGDGGPAPGAEISYPEALACDAAGNVLICDPGNNRLRKVTAATDIMSTVAGESGLFGEGSTALSAQFYNPANIAADATGNLYIADYGNNRVRKLDMGTGLITTVAGTGYAAYPLIGDGGPALSASLSSPSAVAVDDSGNIFIADAGDNIIRKVNAAGIITTVAGDGGTRTFGGDGGAATLAKLNTPVGVAVDHAGNIYIADIENSRIRKVDTRGVISTFAGNSTAGGYSGDGGPAIAAKLQNPFDMVADAIGNIYISDEGNNVIRMVDTNGIITTVAGSAAGTAGFSGDGGAATNAELNYPGGIKVDGAGNLYITDAGNERVRMVSTAGIITTIAGNGTAGFSGDGGNAVSAKLNNPTGLAVGPFSPNIVYFADFYNQRIRGLYADEGVAQVAKTTGLSVYPNPAHDAVTVEAAATPAVGTQLTMMDVAGHVVYGSPMLLKTQTISLQQLPAGVYMLQMTDGTGAKTTAKVVKE